MINNYDMQKIHHDIKRISRCVKLIREEESKMKRDTVLELLMNELDRLNDDLEEIKEANN